MKKLAEFFQKERQRIFAPDAYFAQRVMARLSQKAEDVGVWEMVPKPSRSVLVLAVTLLLCFLALDEFIPVMPRQGPVDMILESEQGAVESRVLSGTEDDGHDFIEELIVMEAEQ